MSAGGGEGEAADEMGGEGAGGQWLAELEGEVGGGIGRGDEMKAGAADGNVSGDGAGVGIGVCRDGADGREARQGVVVGGKRREDRRLPLVRAVVIFVAAAVSGGVVDINEGGVRMCGNREQKSEHRKRDEAKGAGQHGRLLEPK